LFKQLLEALEEDIAGLPFIDILYKLEKLNLLDEAKDWIVLRQTRNAISHEYPFFKEVQIEELNLLPEEVVKLAGIWLKLKGNRRPGMAPYKGRFMANRDASVRFEC
jgi:hypothetical protein